MMLENLKKSATERHMTCSNIFVFGYYHVFFNNRNQDTLYGRLKILLRPVNRPHFGKLVDSGDRRTVVIVTWEYSSRIWRILS